MIAANWNNSQYFFSFNCSACNAVYIDIIIISTMATVSAAATAAATAAADEDLIVRSASFDDGRNGI